MEFFDWELEVSEGLLHICKHSTDKLQKASDYILGKPVITELKPSALLSNQFPASNER